MVLSLERSYFCSLKTTSSSISHSLQNVKYSNNEMQLSPSVYFDYEIYFNRFKKRFLINL